jgi:hypothetical protein
MSPGGVWSPVNRMMALRLVEERMIKGLGPRAILAECAEAGYTESLETVQSWCTEVLATWERESVMMRPHQRNLWRARLEARYRMMVADLDATFTPLDLDGKPVLEADGTPRRIPCFTGIARAKLYDSIARLEKLAFSLDGLDAPTIIKHEGSLDIRAMSPDQRRERIDELLEKRRRLLEQTGN